MDWDIMLTLVVVSLYSAYILIDVVFDKDNNKFSRTCYLATVIILILMTIKLLALNAIATVMPVLTDFIELMEKMTTLLEKMQ